MKVDDEFWNDLMPSIGGIRRSLVGSSYILGSGKDVDMLILVRDMSEAGRYLHAAEWVAESEKYDLSKNKFMSYRNYEDNCLITSDDEFFWLFCTAAEVCRYLAEKGVEQVKDRAVRVAIHAIIRDECAWDEVPT